MPLFALTIFCGAFLLFLVQPLMGKYLLPWFGGGPGVWTTCLLFFQTLLLGGYAYAHFLQRLAPRRQAVVHGVLLVAALAFLPILPNPAWKPEGTEDPVLRILFLLTATLGLPYLVLSATGPLLQRWFSLSHPQLSPYRLYALSNAGSLLALVAYPFFFEPRFSRGALAMGWSGGLVVFAVLCGLCAWRVRQIGGSGSRPTAAGQEPGPPPESAQAPALQETPEDATTTPVDRFLWFALPLVASVLLVATTNKLCLDVAAIPFLWVLPLGLYLLTFIICFDHPRWYRRGPFAAALVLCCLLLARILAISAPPLYQQVVALAGTLFVACMVCHGELHRLRPAASKLTGYYLAIAAGGAGGSLFVTLGAPLLFVDYRELQLGLVTLAYFVGVICWFQRSRTLALGMAAGLAAVPVIFPLLSADRTGPARDWLASLLRDGRAFAGEYWLALAAGAVVLAFALRQGARVAREWQSRLIIVPALFTLLLATLFVQQSRAKGRTIYTSDRNFFGAYRVDYYHEGLPENSRFFVLVNGGITHGMQFTGAPQVYWPTTYYSESSGLGRAIAALPAGPRHFGAVGLGAGTLAAYGRKGDTLRFYELNPSIVGMASQTFAYLANTTATVSVVVGDARLTMERETRTGDAPAFDLLVLDAFAGDAIPVHLLTQEAMALYRQRLRPGGIIAIHISNRHLDLRPVVEGLARDAHLQVVTIADTVAPKDWWLYSTEWMLLSEDADVLARESIRNAAADSPASETPPVLWTDDHASLWEVVR